MQCICGSRRNLNYKETAFGWLMLAKVKIVSWQLKINFKLYSSFQPSLRSMAVLSSRAQERRGREIRARSWLPPQSPRGFSALARLYYLARPTKTAMLRRLISALSLGTRLRRPGVGIPIIFHINLLTNKAMFTGWNPTGTDATNDTINLRFLVQHEHKWL